MLRRRLPVPWHLLNLALASSPYLSSRVTTRSRTNRALPTPWMSDFVARFVGINVFYSRAARAVSERFIVEYSPEVVSALYLRWQLRTLYPLLSRATCTIRCCIHVCICEHRRKNQTSLLVEECALRHQKNRKSERTYRLVKKCVIRFFTSNLFSRRWALCSTVQRICMLCVKCRSRVIQNVHMNGKRELRNNYLVKCLLLDIIYLKLY